MWLGLLSILGMSKSIWKWVVTCLGLGGVSVGVGMRTYQQDISRVPMYWPPEDSISLPAK